MWNEIDQSPFYWMFCNANWTKSNKMIIKLKANTESHYYASENEKRNIIITWSKLTTHQYMFNTRNLIVSKQIFSYVLTLSKYKPLSSGISVSFRLALYHILPKSSRYGV